MSVTLQSAPTSNNFVASTASASAEQALGVNVRRITIVASAAAHIVFGPPGAVPTPVAGQSFFLPANVLVPLEVSRGATSFKVIRNAADGVVYWTVDQ